jgi:hypothetical protein
VLAVTWDFFPIEGTRRTVARARRIWDLHQRGHALELVEDQSIHSYTPVLARAAAQFFARHLLQRDDVDVAALKPQPLPEAQLHATNSGQVRGELPGAEFVFEANLARLNTFEAARRRLDPGTRNSQAIAWLRDRVFFERDAVEPNPRFPERGSRLDELVVDIGFWWSQPRLANLGMLFRSRDHTPQMPVTVALWDNGTAALSRHATLLREECARGRAVLVLNLSGVGPLQPDPINRRGDGLASTFRKFVDDLSFIGDSLAALRTYETLRALDVLATWPGLSPVEIRVYGHGRLGMHAKLAAALDPRIAGCDWRESFRFSEFVRDRNYDSTNIKPVILPGALRYFDLDEL